uniref:Uncharacterized protein n=1 Tax=Arundo donax TaxID=35708 RepID=A0A0A9A2P4_ARUDO
MVTILWCSALTPHQFVITSTLSLSPLYLYISPLSKNPTF